MKIIYTKTSSKGNCSVIESGDGHLLIIDAGIKYKAVDKKIGYRLHKADALLITHSHSDHTAFIKDFLESNISTTCGLLTIAKLGLETNRFVRNFTTTREDFDGFIVKAVPMEHTNSDGTPCECYGFLIFDKSTGEKMLWATDTQFIKNRFPPLDFYCIESNFFESDDYNGEIDYIEKKVEQRRVQSHMSFESAVNFLKMQDLSKCKEIRLLHLTSSSNEEDKKIMKRKLRSQLKGKPNIKDVKIYA